MRATITAIINGHKEGPLLEAAIKSTLAAKAAAHVPIHVLVILDKPDVVTLEIAQKYAELLDIQVVEYGDLGLARNRGVELAQSHFISFLDGDDLWSKNWLGASFRHHCEQSSSAILHPELNYYFDSKNSRKVGHITRHTSSNDENFKTSVLAHRNYWTALAFGPKEIFERFPYRPVSIELGTGFEDWTFNLETHSAGVPHLVVPKTVHFIREKTDGSMRRLHASRDATFYPTSLNF